MEEKSFVTESLCKEAIGRQPEPNLQLHSQLHMEYSFRKAKRTSYEWEKEQRVAGKFDRKSSIEDEHRQARNWTGVKKSASRFYNEKNHVRIHEGSDHRKELEIFFISFNNQKLTLKFTRATIGLSAKHNHFLFANLLTISL